MQNLSKYSKITLAAAFFVLMIFAAHEKYLLFVLGFAVAAWIVVRSRANEERLECLIEAARNDANTYRGLWQLECKTRTLEKPQEKQKKPTGYEFH